MPLRERTGGTDSCEYRCAPPSKKTTIARLLGVVVVRIAAVILGESGANRPFSNSDRRVQAAGTLNANDGPAKGRIKKTKNGSAGVFFGTARRDYHGRREYFTPFWRARSETNERDKQKNRTGWKFAFLLENNTEPGPPHARADRVGVAARPVHVRPPPSVTMTPAYPPVFRPSKHRSFVFLSFPVSFSLFGPRPSLYARLYIYIPIRPLGGGTSILPGLRRVLYARFFLSLFLLFIIVSENIRRINAPGPSHANDLWVRTKTKFR